MGVYIGSVRLRLGAGAALVLLTLALPVWAVPTAPAFTLRLLDQKKTFDSRSLLGKKVLVVRFQASWCQVCVREAPAFERLYRKYRGRGVEFVGVQVQDTPADARKFLRAHRASYLAGLDPDLRIANRFGFKDAPETVVISRKGEIAARLSGPSSEAELAKAIDRLLPRRKKAEPPPHDFIRAAS